MKHNLYLTNVCVNACSVYIVSGIYPLHNDSFVLDLLLQVLIYSWSGGGGGGGGGEYDTSD